ncbi:hypothetical protein NK718_20035 [Alsobacter sp. SYSU M60028]|uniref:Uncharacterized protein n=1 Tax=Alsobacter ponti TaxID=2962936 RepID=A0ABT1LH43_9HYPH|nr:hypothetical protein [Alsobacter ponti]MCP8940822.1 hypothetical protein [Alsobacter ponti]
MRERWSTLVKGLALAASLAPPAGASPNPGAPETPAPLIGRLDDIRARLLRHAPPEQATPDRQAQYRPQWANWNNWPNYWKNF